jgi:hypothetical protein
VNGGVEHIIQVNEITDPGDHVVHIETSGLEPVIRREGVVSLLNDNGLEQGTYSGLAVWDAFHRPLTSWFDVVDGQIEIHIETDDATVLPITVDPLLSFLNYQSGQMGTEYGSALAAGLINNDAYVDIVVGQPLFASGQANEGRAIVYFGNADGVTMTAGPTFEGNATGANCGRTVTVANIDADASLDVLVGCSSNGATSGLNNGRGGLMAFLNTAGNGTFSATPNRTFVHPTDAFVYVLLDVVAIQVDNNAAVGTTAYETEIFAWAQPGTPGTTQVHMYRYSNGSAPVDRIASGTTTSLALAPFKRVNTGTTKSLAVATDGVAKIFDVSASGFSNPGLTIPSGVSATTTTIATNDLNKDGFSDLVLGMPFAETVTVLRSQQNGVLPPTWPTHPGFPLTSGGLDYDLGSMVGFSDFNRDRFPDVLYCGRNIENVGGCVALGGTPSGFLNMTTSRFSTLGSGDSYLGDIGDRIGYGNIEEVGDNDDIDDLLLPIPGAASFTIFDGEPATLKTTPDIYPSQTSAPSSQQGYAVTMGDLNNDGYDDLVVGAPMFSTNRGAVFVYFGGSTPDNIADWCSKGAQAGEFFGGAVAVAKTRGPSNAATLVIGSPSYDDNVAGITESGMVQFFNGPLASSCNLANAPILSNQSLKGTVNSASFGVSIANIKNGMNTLGDGIAIGAPGKTFSTVGQVLIYPSNGAGITATGALAVSGNSTRINCFDFGRHVANAGNVDGSDSRDDILVGAQGCSSNGLSNNGKAFIIKSTATSMALSSWSVSGVESGAQLGVVAAAGDVNNNGVADFAIGAAYEDNSGYSPTVVDAGRVRVYAGSATGAPSTTAFMSMSTAYAGGCGSAITSGDYNLDGISDIAVGEPRFSNSTSTPNEGRIRVFFGGDGSFESNADSIIEGNVSGLRFGASVATGDLKKDTYPDVAVGTPGHSSSMGRAVVHSGQW